MARTCSPLQLRSPSPHTLLTTLSDPLHQRALPGLRRSQSADHQHHPSSSTSSCHASLPLPSQLRAAHSPGRRKLPAIPASAANNKFPSVIRITRAQLQQVNRHSHSVLPITSTTSAHQTCLLSSLTVLYILDFFYFIYIVVFDCNTEVMLFLVCSLLRELQEYCSVRYACPVKFSVKVVSLKLWTLLIALFLQTK